MLLLSSNNKCLTSNRLRASEITTSEYARRLIIAEQLAVLGCKWPILHEQLSIRVTDAQRLMTESKPEGFSMARLETGLSWFKVSGTGNARMLHATFLYKIFCATEKDIPDANIAEVLLYAYRRYQAMVKTPVFDNINRAWFMITSIKQSRGFSLRKCTSCAHDFVSLKLSNHANCPACERNKYIQCEECHTLISKPYVPGANGGKRTTCGQCTEVLRKKKRKLRDKRRSVYISTAVLR